MTNCLTWRPDLNKANWILPRKVLMVPRGIVRSLTYFLLANIYMFSQNHLGGMWPYFSFLVKLRNGILTNPSLARA